MTAKFTELFFPKTVNGLTRENNLAAVEANLGLGKEMEQ
tara:strand:- start:9 stop:125 length:117 start_codon:yes stop_codon:yes gene_type:complete